MMNQDNPYAMNQTCKVCGEPAAGFHFGAFTCEGCKSFFGRSYNNLSSISDCKNNGECIINKKNRTACKACRLRKCLMVGMSKSGSRYGRRSNWFKIHCLLQEQQQQAAAAMAAHQNSQQAGGSLATSLHGKMPTIPTSAATAAALGMLGHGGPYAGLYQPRTKEELMMLSLEEYSKHPSAGSPSVSSPDSHHSDSSVEVNGRTNALGLHIGGCKASSHTEGASSSTISAVPSLPPPTHPTAHLRKDMSPFLPLSAFPALSAMPVMPPPSFLPSSHLLFPGYHPALYQHHAAAASLMKPSPEQQAAAAAVQQLFNNNPRFATSNTLVSAFSHETQQQQHLLHHLPINIKHDNPRQSIRTPPPKRVETINQNSSNHLPNGSKSAAAGELTKRFYLDAVLKSQRQTPPPAATKLTNVSIKHDHSISALVTPNSESDREQRYSLHTNEGASQQRTNENPHQLDNTNHQVQRRHDLEQHSSSNGQESDCRIDDDDENDDDDDVDDDEDVVVSMTPPRSPIRATELIPIITATNSSSNSCSESQDNPIDLSMKAVSSVDSCRSRSRSTTQSSSPELREMEASQKSLDDLEYKQKFLNNNNNNNNNNNDKLKEECAIFKATKRKLESLESREENPSNKKLSENDKKADKSVNKITGSPLDLTHKA